MSDAAILHPMPRRIAPRAARTLSSRSKTIILIGIVVLAAVVRVPGLFTDFWGDEIWSWSIAGQLHSVSGVLLATPARIDNNHPLNTLWLYLLGSQAPVWLYRMPSLLAGIGSVIVAAHAARRWSFAASAGAAIFVGFSYPMVFYSTEARGYSLAVFFALAAFDALATAIENGRAGAAWLFGAAAALGLLSHLTFLHVCVAALLWSVIASSHLPGNRRAALLLRLHVLPLLTACALTMLFTRYMVIGGAAPTRPARVIVETLSLTLNGPSGGIGAVIVAAAALLVFTAALSLRMTSNRREWVFFFVAVIASPTLTTAAELCLSDRPQPLMPRYFIVCAALMLLAVARLMDGGTRGGVLRRGGGPSGAPLRAGIRIAAVSAFLIGAAIHLAGFARLGRGRPADALAHIMRQSGGDDAMICSDNPGRTRLLLSFYAPRLHMPIAWVDGPAPWLILNRSAATGPTTYTFDGRLYQLESVYPSDALSGWAWLVYRRR